MLTRQQGLATYDFAGGRLVPDRLTRRAHGRYVELAERMLTLYRHGVGRTRQELHRGVADILAEELDCPVRRVQAFCKLLDDASEYRTDRAGAAAELRREVFRRAARKHPLVVSPDQLFEQSEQEVKQAIAAELGRTWEDIDRELFADVMEFHRLERFQGFDDAPSFLARYNVAQVQVALYGASSLHIAATTDLKTILTYAKLARLLHSIRQDERGVWHIRLDGPASVLQETQRYGVQLAKFLPALIACRDWRMTAVVPVGRQGAKLRLTLSSRDGLRSHLPAPEEFDSEVEAAFAKRWGDAPREGWKLLRETEVLFENQHVFFPDFTFQHDDGRRVHLEIIGFWTPEYLRAKQATLQRFARHPILLAIAQSNLATVGDWPSTCLIYKTRLKVDSVLDRLRMTPRPTIMPPRSENGEQPHDG